MRTLMEAMREAWAEIERDPLGGLAAPRPYPELAAPGTLWRHSRSYWVAIAAPHVLRLPAFFMMRPPFRSVCRCDCSAIRKRKTADKGSSVRHLAGHRRQHL